jgi:hypothetical protein
VHLNPYDPTANALLAACLLQHNPTITPTAPWLLVYRWLKQLEEAGVYQANSQRIAKDTARLQTLMMQVLKEGTHDPSVAYEIGMICMRFGQWNEARDWFAVSLGLDADYQPARQEFERCQRMLGAL